MEKKRKSISKKTRFEVFKRDSFRCQYCGKSAPDVVLNVDHIKPVAEGGTNELINLITSCFDCNQGKKHRLLDDNSMLEKQKKQLEELNERRQQLEMMMKWREGLVEIDNNKLEIVQEKFEELAECTVTESGIKKLKALIKKYDLALILDCIEISTNQYLQADKKGGYTDESRAKAFNYIGRICANKLKQENEPDYLKEIYYIRGILRNRLSYCNEKEALILLKKAVQADVSIDSLKELAIDVRNWTQFKNAIEEFLEGVQ